MLEAAAGQQPPRPPTRPHTTTVTHTTTTHNHTYTLERAQLEAAATAGIALVLGLTALLAARAALAGFPGIASGDVPLWRLRVDGHLPEAFSVLGARRRAAGRRPAAQLRRRAVL